MSTQYLASAMLSAYTVSNRKRFLSDSFYFHKLMTEQIVYDDNCELIEKAIGHGAGKVILQYLDKRIWPVEEETSEFRGLLQTRVGFTPDEAEKIIKYLYYLAGWEQEKPTDTVECKQSTSVESPMNQTPSGPFVSSSMRGPQVSPTYTPAESTYEPQMPPAYAPVEPIYKPQVPPAYTPAEPAYEPQVPPAYTPAEPAYEPQVPPAYEPEPIYEPEVSPAYTPAAIHEPQPSPVAEMPTYEVADPNDIGLYEPSYESAVPVSTPVRSDITITEKMLNEGLLASSNTVLDGTGYTLEYFYPYLVQRINEMAIPANVSIGRLKCGGLLTPSYEDIIVITHSERPKDYGIGVVHITYTGKSAFVNLYAVGKDKSEMKGRNAQQNSALFNKLTGAAAKAQREMEKSYHYYEMLGMCFAMAFDDSTC